MLQPRDPRNDNLGRAIGEARPGEMIRRLSGYFKALTESEGEPVV